ncbi:hypothetical protein GCM10027589_26410 [Actinocorallia lasiicapitis]
MQPRLPRESVIVTMVVGLSAAATVGLFANGVVVAFGSGQPWKFVIGTMAAMLVVVLQGRLLWQSAYREISRDSRIFLAVIAVVVFALPLLLGGAWNQGMAAVAGMIAVTLPERLSIPLVGLAAALTGVISTATGAPGLEALWIALSLPVYGLSAYATVWLCLAVKELRDARTELARRAVGEERLRFARDLHDVLGHSLQAVALRAELAERLLAKDPDRVAKELEEIQRMARGAIQEVRDVVRGYRVTSLRTELNGATAVLRAAGITCSTPQIPDDLPRHVHDALGWVAREAVTNVLRHSGATRCELTLTADPVNAVLTIVNDGARRSESPGRRDKVGRGLPEPSAGSGLTGLRERVVAVGGELRAAALGDGAFEVRAIVPLSGLHL